jgi:plasmid stabilization system protein ParE
MAQVEFAPRALADLVRLRAWLSDKNPAADERAAQAIVERIQQLERRPLSAPKIGDTEVRQLRIRFGKYGYVARYAVRGEMTVVARIFHGPEDR